MGKHASLTTKSHLRLVSSSEVPSIQISLPMLAALQSAKQGLFELCVDVGQQVLGAMMERDREELCGPKGRHIEGRRAHRSGSSPSQVTLGGRRIQVPRLRARSTSGQELSLPSFRYFAERDPLDEHTLHAIGCGVSTRKYQRHLEVLPSDLSESGVSKSAVSQRFVTLSRKQLAERLSASLSDFDVRILILDGIVLHEHTVLIALGIDSDGEKRVLGLREGPSESEAVAKELLRELIDRGLPTDRALLFVLDGSKGLRSAVRKVFGAQGIIQRCQVHSVPSRGTRFVERRVSE